jgi:hypothetical protein
MIMSKKIGFVAFLLAVTVSSVYAGNKCTPKKTADGCYTLDFCIWDGHSGSCKLNCEKFSKSDCARYPTNCKWTKPPRGEAYCAFKDK